MQSKPAIFRPLARPSNLSASSKFSPCPLVLQERRYNRDIYIDMSDFIRDLQNKTDGLTTDPMQGFEVPGEEGQFHLADPELQRFLHCRLRRELFDFTNFPLSLKKWNRHSETWELLTIDCHLMVASFLVHLDRHKAGDFVDTIHNDQKIVIKVEEKRRRHDFLERNIFDHLLITPYLHNTDGRNHMLLLSISASLQFPNLRITVPTFEVRPRAEFECSICLQVSDPMDGRTLIRTGCDSLKGHCFHEDCLDTWHRMGRSTCPYCRRQIVANV